MWWQQNTDLREWLFQAAIGAKRSLCASRSIVMYCTPVAYISVVYNAYEYFAHVNSAMLTSHNLQSRTLKMNSRRLVNIEIERFDARMHFMGFISAKPTKKIDFFLLFFVFH